MTDENKKDGATDNTTKYRLLVLEDIKADPSYYRRQNLIRYRISKNENDLSGEEFMGKVTAVWDLRDKGAFRIDNNELRGLKYESYLEVLQPEFEKIYDNLKNSADYLMGKKPMNWEWGNRNKGIYQFGKINFQQTGKTRKEVFVALMDLFELNQFDISIGIVATKAKIKPERVRIEISAINKRFIKKTGHYFKGSGRGYYTINKSSSSIK